jgi:hypothetical protein
VTYTETDLVASIECLAGDDLAALSQEQRDQFDQFHSGGSEAVDRLLPGLHLTPGMTVLDGDRHLTAQSPTLASSQWAEGADQGCPVIGRATWDAGSWSW